MKPPSLRIHSKTGFQIRPLFVWSALLNLASILKPQLSCGALESNPTDPVLLSNRSAAFAGLKRFKDALKDANACVWADPDFIKGYSRQGFAYAALKQSGPAEKAYRQGLSKNANNAGLKQGLATLLQVALHDIHCLLLQACITVQHQCSAINASAGQVVRKCVRWYAACTARLLLV